MNMGQTASLTRAVPQGINPAILILDLKMVQKPGIWPQAVVPRLVRFDIKDYAEAPHSQVTIRSSAECSVTIDVEAAR
jgi:hypothetical protein